MVFEFFFQLIRKPEKFQKYMPSQERGYQNEKTLFSVLIKFNTSRFHLEI